MDRDLNKDLDRDWDRAVTVGSAVRLFVFCLFSCCRHVGVFRIGSGWFGWFDVRERLVFFCCVGTCEPHGSFLKKSIKFKSFI